MTIYIGFMGKAGAGKDTLANAVKKSLKDQHHLIAQTYSFADPLKEMVSYVFDIPKVWLYDHELKKKDVYVTFNQKTLERMSDWVLHNIASSDKWGWHIARHELSYGVCAFASDYRYQDVAAYLLCQCYKLFLRKCTSSCKSGGYITPININGVIKITIRNILQLVGTELIRNHVDDHFWAECKYDYKNKDVVLIPDCRFESELDFIYDNGGFIIHVTSDKLNNDTSTYKHSSETFVDTIDEYMEKTGKTYMTYFNKFSDDGYQESYLLNYFVDDIVSQIPENERMNKL
ncbi:MAG: hypothetical protein R3230_00595 [Nitrosopumilaceae archaeon]|nr:hypothetical protein [Nitrosopumilaceae archaeon]